MNGGTCLHKLWLPEARRYSEDLDYIIREPDDPNSDDKTAIVDEMIELGRSLGFHFNIQKRILKSQFPKAIFRFNETVGGKTDLRIKVEFARTEASAEATPVVRPHIVNEPWLSSSVDVQTMPIGYMAASKVMATFSMHGGCRLVRFMLVLCL